MSSDTLKRIIHDKYNSLAAKGKLLSDFVLSKPGKAVFMTTRQLGAAVGVSEATVIRFVRQLGFETYALFIQSLRDMIDQQFTLLERKQIHPTMANGNSAGDNELDWAINGDITNIKAMQKNMDIDTVKKVRNLLKKAPHVYVIGSRLSFSLAHYMGWTLNKIRPHVSILEGSDRTSMDQMIFAPKESVVVIIATSRYPNELVRMGKIAKRHHLRQILITDSLSCPLTSFSEHTLVAPMTHIPFLGNPVSLVSMIHYILCCLASDMEDELKTHQAKLEQAYLENDIWFN